jgi:hypothetical protein
LSFSNNPLGYFQGNAATARCLPNVAELYPTSNVGSLPSGAIPNVAQKKFIFVTAGSLTIPSDIIIPTPFGSATDIPRVIIYARGNIAIAANVQRLDATIITNGILYTCDTAAPNATQCNLPLAINGGVIAGNDVVPGRTAGGEISSLNVYGETFNLNPAITISEYEQARQNDAAITTIRQTELPPRF